MSDKSQFSIHNIELGPMENFIYLIEDHASGNAAIVDPAWDVPELLQWAADKGVKITDILLTHCHHDHINGVQEMVDHTDAQVHLLKAENSFWQPGFMKTTTHHGGDHIKIGNTEIDILHTPGHSVGSACYQLDKQLITGDTLFVFGCGHCRLAGADPETLYHTLTKLKKEMPSDTVIHPGHNYSHQATTTMAEQIHGNPFLHFDNQYDFIKYRMEIHDRIRSDPYDPITEEEMHEHCHSGD